jgi:hypothetical protein
MISTNHTYRKPTYDSKHRIYQTLPLPVVDRRQALLHIVPSYSLTHRYRRAFWMTVWAGGRRALCLGKHLGRAVMMEVLRRDRREVVQAERALTVQ